MTKSKTIELGGIKYETVLTISGGRFLLRLINSKTRQEKWFSGEINEKDE
jgi:hypothetical protein